MRKRPWIKTYTGRNFNLQDPCFHIEDIAHALSHLCRFNGHTSQFYSVAEHSVAVSDFMLSEGQDPLEGLLHDAAEAYLGDVSAPWKQLLPDFQRIEDALEVKIRRRFSLPGRKSKGCNRADKLLAHVEAFYLLPGGGEDFPDEWGLKQESETFRGALRPLMLPPAEAKTLFLAKFKQLRKD